ncbi:hypothetical protein N7517_004931 [Penicillium concentricum]|uniref:Uncharacterized protein n=1 Tax=Penicillium concentricum TaxID=293559 RepID=A0A9W9VAZ1_9EURO|nr:uncharacterized protein N7517_004931 [Penicillium concentricum]KAJ5372925.1 hypothetical protein N7517_004931 [Penicillium concentricum]
MAPFSKSGLQVLAGEYLAGAFLKWDETSLFDQLFAAGSEPEMFVVSWELTELLCKMVIVVGPGSPQTYLLRAVLAPEFAWFGLHWAGMPHPAQVSTYPSDLLDLLHSRPLAASVALHQNLGVGEKWKALVHSLWAHLEPYRSYFPAGRPQPTGGNDNDVLPPMVDVEYPPSPVEEDVEGVLPMEGVEFGSVPMTGPPSLPWLPPSPWLLPSPWLCPPSPPCCLPFLRPAPPPTSTANGTRCLREDCLCLSPHLLGASAVIFLVVSVSL